MASCSTSLPGSTRKSGNGSEANHSARRGLSARGKEIRKTRPCVVVSPDDLNARLPTFLIVPLTTGSFPYAFRVPCRFAGRNGHIIVEQVRGVDSTRLGRRLGTVSTPTLAKTLSVLRQMFET